MNPMTVPDKLAVDKFELDEGHPHIAVDNEICRKVCGDKLCLWVCPANVYAEHDGAIAADWAGCLECGACRAACPHDALKWEYPRGGFGIVYRYG